MYKKKDIKKPDILKDKKLMENINKNYSVSNRAKKQLIVINRIRNKSLFTYYVYVLCIFIMYIKYIHVYTKEKF